MHGQGRLDDLRLRQGSHGAVAIRQDDVVNSVRRIRQEESGLQDGTVNHVRPLRHIEVGAGCQAQSGARQKPRPGHVKGDLPIVADIAGRHPGNSEGYQLGFQGKGQRTARFVTTPHHNIIESRLGSRNGHELICRERIVVQEVIIPQVGHRAVAHVQFVLACAHRAV